MRDEPIARLLITLCTYNERENLERLIPEIRSYAPDADILVIDDNSPDGTGDLAERMAAEDSRLRVMHRPNKQGLGSATIAGFQYACEHNYQAVLNMDADFSHHPRYIPVLRDGLQRADVAVGSRYIKGGSVKGWGWLRHLMSRGINAYARRMLGLRIRDTSGSFRCYRLEKLRELDFSRLRAQGYAFQEEILYRCQQIGARLDEIPILFEDRQQGRSKINWRESLQALWDIFCLGIERVRRVEGGERSRSASRG